MNKKLNDFESYSENPSKILEEDIKTLHYISKGKVVYFVDENGEQKQYQELGEEVNKTIDTREYRKVFVEDLQNLKDLSTAGLKVLCYILKNLGVKRDEVNIDIIECMAFTGYKSKVNIYIGIVELLDKKLIFRKVGSGNYFINVNSYYNGNRQ